jgi:hypothetical protein
VLRFLRGQAVVNPHPVLDSDGDVLDYITPDGPGINPNLFNNPATDETKVFIFTPLKEDVGHTPGAMNNPANLHYQARYGPGGEVSDTITNHLGIAPEVQMVPYHPLDTGQPGQQEEMDTTARGSILFQYDPNSDPMGTRRWRLLAEDRYFTAEV